MTNEKHTHRSEEMDPITNAFFSKPKWKEREKKNTRLRENNHQKGTNEITFLRESMVGVSATWIQLYWSGSASPQPSKTTKPMIFPLGSLGWSANFHENPERDITFFFFSFFFFSPLFLHEMKIERKTIPISEGKKNLDNNTKQRSLKVKDFTLTKPTEISRV